MTPTDDGEQPGRAGAGSGSPVTVNVDDAEVDRRAAEQADQNGAAASDEDQHDPDQRLDEGEHPAADVVGDLAAEQGGAGQEGHAGAEADAATTQQRDRQVRRQRQQHHGRRRRSTIDRPNSRRRDRSRAITRAERDAEPRPTKTAPNSRP